jgi:hypothetical protein
MGKCRSFREIGFVISARNSTRKTGLKVIGPYIKSKSKAIPVTGREGPYGCETLKVPHYLDSRLKDGSKFDSLTRRPRFTPLKNYLINSWYSFLLEAE